jgi:hypothetical protein
MIWVTTWAVCAPTVWDHWIIREGGHSRWARWDLGRCSGVVTGVCGLWARRWEATRVPWCRQLKALAGQWSQCRAVQFGKHTLTGTLAFFERVLIQLEQ